MQLYTLIKIESHVKVIANSVSYFVNMNGFSTLQLSLTLGITGESTNKQIKLFPEHYQSLLFITSILGFDYTLLSLYPVNFPFLGVSS